jgi:lipid A 3-O-deacylase
MLSRTIRIGLLSLALIAVSGFASAQMLPVLSPYLSSSAREAATTGRETNPLREQVRPFEWGVLAQGGFGVTENRNSFRFFMAGVHAGKVLTGNAGHGVMRGNFEYAMELWPLWQSYTPKGQRQNCVPVTGFSGLVDCSPPFKIGGTFTGASLTPIILRWNFVGTSHFSPWVQGAGGLLWTNHKYPAYGGPPISSGGITNSSIGNNAANSDTSVWNFTPQFGVGVHCFVSAHRSVEFGANAIHISSASLGDKNPGVNASVQFTLGYSWWK